MKYNQINITILAKAWLLTILAVLLASCSGGNGDVGTAPPGSTTPTTVSGKVSISRTVSSKPMLLADILAKTELQQLGNSKRVTNHNTSLLKALSATTLAIPADLSGASVELFDADKSEWLAPVASDTTDSDGNYSLNTLINADKNLKENGLDADGLPIYIPAYINGKPVLPGNYTVIARKYDADTRTTLVAVQAIVKKFAGNTSGNNLVAQDSDAVPTVVSMLGLAKNSDGSFGSATTSVPVNANIQVFFSMAMDRSSIKDPLNIKDGINITASGQTTPIAGKWKISPDLTAATFYPDEDMIPDTAYSIAVTGGTLANAVKNVYDKALAEDVSGSFRTAPRDATPPTAQRNSPKGTTLTRSMPIITPIRIEVDEELDISSLQIISKPSIGDKPTIKYVGKSTASSDAEYPYIYEIVPSDALKLNTNYSISVSGGLDMVGLSMYVLNFGFTTETTSSGITGTTQDEINNQLAVKIVLGKWIGALNARNTALLTSYMTGDFFWLNNTAQGFSRNDLNRDGRLSLNEFTAMLNTWFKDLDRCGSTVTGDVDTVNGGIVVNGSTASIAFNITAAPTNTSDATCDTGPDKTLYAVMENINQAWLMTSGSEYKLDVALTPLTPIELISPVKGIQLADPSLTSPPPQPIEFQWTAVDGVNTYMLVAIDNQSRQLRTGWAALVDGASAGTPMSAKFIGKPGDYGNIIVLDTGMSNPLGFDGMITQINPGGDYSWAVIGFETKTKEEFKILNFNLANFLIASSESSNFTVEGVLRALRVEVTGASGTVYPYSDTVDGYNVGSEASVTITVITPNVTTQPGTVSVYGYVQKSYGLSFSAAANGLNTAIATPVTLSNVSNRVRVDDGTGVVAYPPAVSTKSLTAEFNIYTKGGALPKIGISSVTAKKCDGTTAATLIGPNGWNNYSSADTCMISVTGTVDPLFTGSIAINVGNNDGNGNYNSSAVISGTSYTFTNIPVFSGQNWVSISYAYYPVSAPFEYHNNNFGVNTVVGNTYDAPITAVVTGAGVTDIPSSDKRQSYWDAAALDSVSVDVAMRMDSAQATCLLASDPSDPAPIPCTLTGKTSNLTVTLYRGWSYIYLFDGFNRYTVIIYTTGGTVATLPNIVTNISIPGGVTPPAPTPSTKPYLYDADSACAVTVTGTTTSAGLVNVNLNYYNSTTKASFNETQSVTASGVSPPYDYTFTQTVYGNGSNMIDIRDGGNSWQGVQVSSTCTNPLPVVFGVSTISDVISGVVHNISPDPRDIYNTAAGSVTVAGTASAGKTITAYVKGQYASTYSITIGDMTNYNISLPLYTGDNYISMTDGNNWIYRTVRTTAGGAVYVSPINTVAVSNAKLLKGGGISDSYSAWDSSANTVIISGSALVAGTGYFYQSYVLAGTYYENKGTFTASTIGGAFTLLSSAGSNSIPLGYGDNNFTLNDAKGNIYDLTIHTSGGIGAPPAIVQIQGPLDGVAGLTGLVKVYGTIASSFVPVAVRAYTYDYVTGTYTYFSNQDYEIKLGNTALDYSNGVFVFAVPVVLGHKTFIYVYADNALKERQDQGIYVNGLPQ